MPLTVLPCKLWGVIGCTLRPAGIDLLSGTKTCCFGEKTKPCTYNSGCLSKLFKPKVKCCDLSMIFQVNLGFMKGV